MAETATLEPFEAAEPRQLRISYRAAHSAELRQRAEQAGTQHIGEGAKLLWQEHDLREVPPESAAQWFVRFLETDRKQKLRGSFSSGLRCSLVRFAGERAELIWSFHPSLMPNGTVEKVVRDLTRDGGERVAVTQGTTSLQTSNSQFTGQRGSPRIAHVRAAPQINPNGHAPATDDTERELSEIWKIVIGRSGFTRDEDFFEAGGHSLSAARLVAHIEKRMGVEVPLAALLESPTLAHQAMLIREARQTATRASQHVPVAPSLSTREIPLFFLAGDATFRPLVKRLSTLRKVHSLGLQGSALAKLGSPPEMREIAQDFVAEVTRREPAGPFALGGWCAHGLLALEVAQQLKQRGRETAQIVMLEVSNPVALKNYSSWRRFVSRQQLKLHLLDFERMYLAQLNGQSAREYLRGRLAKKMKALHGLLSDGNGNGVDSNGNGNLLEILYAAAASYIPSPYPGRVLLVRSSQRTLGFASDERLGWRESVLPQLELVRVPGNHYTIYMPPNADVLALTVHDALRETESTATEKTPASRERLPLPTPGLHRSAASGMAM